MQTSGRKLCFWGCVFCWGEGGGEVSFGAFWQQTCQTFFFLGGGGVGKEV